MSKLLNALERVGTVSMKFQFEIILHSLHYSSSPPLSCPVCMKWTRGPRQLRSEAVYGVSGVYSWPESKNCLTMICTLYSKKGKFQSKKCKLSVKAVLNKDYKTLGYVEIDLADFAAPYPLSKEFNMKLGHCSDKKAAVKFTLNAKWLKQLGTNAAENENDDTVSQISGISVLNSQNSDSELHDNHEADDDAGMEKSEEDAATNSGGKTTHIAAGAGDDAGAPLSGKKNEAKGKNEEEGKRQSAPVGPAASSSASSSSVKKGLELKKPKEAADNSLTPASATKTPKTSNISPLPSPKSSSSTCSPSSSSSSSSSVLSPPLDTASVHSSIDELKKDAQAAQAHLEEKSNTAKALKGQLQSLTDTVKSTQQSNSLSNERLESFFAALMKADSDLSGLVKSLDDDKRRSQNLLASFTLMEQRLDFIKENSLKETERLKDRVRKLEESERALKKRADEERKKWEEEKKTMNDSLKEKLKEMRAKVAKSSEVEATKPRKTSGNPFAGDSDDDNDAPDSGRKKSPRSTGGADDLKKENARLLDALNDLKQKFSAEEKKSSDLCAQLDELKQNLNDCDSGPKSGRKSLYALNSEEEIHRELRRRRHEETAVLVDSLLDANSELKISPAKHKSNALPLGSQPHATRKADRKEQQNHIDGVDEEVHVAVPEERPLAAMEDEEKNETIVNLRRAVEQLKRQVDDLKARNSALVEKNGVLNKLAEEVVPNMKNELKLNEEKISWMQRQNDIAQKKYEDDRKKWLDEEKSLHRQLDGLRTQRQKFDVLQQSALKSTTEKTLQARVQFYEGQLQEAEEILMHTKKTWQETNGILQEQVVSLEREVSQLKSDLAEERTLKGNESLRISQLDAKLKKAELAKTKLSELMNRFEVELVQKKIDLANQADSLNNLDYEHQRVISALHKANQQIEIQNKQIAVLKNTIAKLENAHRDANAGK